MRLGGKVALVTGASHERGIGRGIALALAAEGADVVCGDIGFADAGAELADELRGMGRRSAFATVDVSDRASVDSLIASVSHDFGSLDIVVSNAGTADWQEVVEITDESFDRIVAVNLTGAFNVGQAAALAMVRSGTSGRIVFTSSVHVQMGFPSMAIYGSTKQGAAGAGRDDGDRAGTRRHHGQPHRPWLGEVAAERRLSGPPDARRRGGDVAADSHPQAL